LPVIDKVKVLDSAVDADGDTVPDRVRVDNNVASVVVIDEIPVPLPVEGLTVTVATDEFVNR